MYTHKHMCVNMIYIHLRILNMFANKNKQTLGMSKKKKKKFIVSILGDIQSYLKILYTTLCIFLQL